MAKYLEIVRWVENRIKNGELADGDKLPPENELGAMFGYSRQTVRHALSVLGKKGILESRQGSGNYIRSGQSAVSEDTREKRIKVISTYINSYLFPRVLQGMTRTLEAHGCSVGIAFTYNHIDDEKRVLEEVLGEDVDGVIAEPVMSGIPNVNCDLYEKIREKGIPVLFFHSYYPGLGIPHVSLNDVEAGKAAAEYLISLGHRRIAGIFKSDDGQGQRRYQGYVEALRAHDIPIRESRVVWLDTEDERNFTYSRDRILNRMKGCTACVCYNDEVAHALTGLLQEEGIAVPNEVSLASVDNSELARLNAVPLTSVIHPMESLGERAAENLLAMIREPDCDGTYEFPVEIKVRESAVRCRARG